MSMGRRVEDGRAERRVPDSMRGPYTWARWALAEGLGLARWHRPGCPSRESAVHHRKLHIWWEACGWDKAMLRA